MSRSLSRPAGRGSSIMTRRMLLPPWMYGALSPDSRADSALVGAADGLAAETFIEAGRLAVVMSTEAGGGRAEEDLQRCGGNRHRKARGAGGVEHDAQILNENVDGGFRLLALGQHARPAIA